MKIWKLSLLSLSIIFLSACGNLRIKAYQPFMAPAKAKTVALASFYFAPPALPEVPAGDADDFNEKVFKLEDDLNAEMQKRAGEYYQLLDQGIEMQLGMDSRAGSELEQGARYERSQQKQELEALQIEGKRHFKQILVGEGGLNFFEFKQGDIKGYIEESPRLRSAVRGNLKNLEAEVMAVGMAQLTIDKVTRYGQKANLKLKVNLYFFDDNGQPVGHGYGESEPITFDGTEITDYELILDQYADLQKEILTEMSKSEE